MGERIVYTPEQIAEMFAEAMEKEEFLVYYQPKVELHEYHLSGAEALCRWVHNGQMIFPNEFIPVYEQNGMIEQLDFYMLDHACADIRRWLDEGREAVRVSVNLSRVHMGDPILLDALFDIIDRHRIPYHYVEIELTETTTDVDFKELRRIVTGLREAGVHTSVDDFGVGYSSMNLLRELPWSVIKIDKSFVPTGDGRDPEDERKLVLFHFLVAMSQALGLKCIAEGVETIEQIAILKENHCSYAQGYYFDKPLPVAEFETRLSTMRDARRYA